MCSSDLTVKAGPSRLWIKSARNLGIARCGSPLGIPPKRVPIVSTGSLKKYTASVPRIRATIGPGMRAETARQTIRVRTVNTASAVVEKPKPIEVHVDRPFIFAIQHAPSGACLFLGRVTDPR